MKRAGPRPSIQDPFGAFPHLPVQMIRQGSQALIQRALALLDTGPDDPAVEMIAPALAPPRTRLSGAPGEQG